MDKKKIKQYYQQRAEEKVLELVKNAVGNNSNQAFLEYAKEEFRKVYPDE